MTEPIEDTRSLPTVTIYSIISILYAILSLTGNSLMCLAFYRNRRLRTVTNFYVLSLAIDDIMITTLTCPFVTVATGLRKWPFNFNFCQFIGFISHFWGVMSVNILALTAVNRYICMIKPHLYPVLFTRKKTFFSILFVLLLTFAAILIATLVTPLLFKWHPFYFSCEVTGLDVLADVSNATTGVFALAISLILFCYVSVYRAIKRHNSAVNPSLQEATSQGTVSAHEIQVSRVLLAAVLAFCVSWIPLTVLRILKSLVHLSVPSFWLSFSTLSAASSLWTNPVIYGVMNRAMRKEFLKLLRCRSEN